MEKFLLLHEVHSLAKTVRRFLAANRLNPEVVLQGAQLVTIASMVAAGLGVTVIPAMMADTADSDVRAHVMALIDRCPSGSYTYAVDPDSEDIEPDLPAAIAVTTEESELAGALWVTGGIPIIRSDGQPLQTRNRVTLCRCGRSRTKPLCDGTHREVNFTETQAEGQGPPSPPRIPSLRPRE
jgi:hypothetical protein